jgi:hypothetical protein
MSVYIAYISSIGSVILSILKTYLNPEQPPPSTITLKNEFGCDLTKFSILYKECLKLYNVILFIKVM